jgi:phospho-N-acetylmuramoyl-pentapeptide-transferase
VTVELIQGLLLAFAIMVILMPPYIRMLRATGFTKQIRIEGPEAHLVKHGTPTAGGALIILVVLALYLLLRWPPEGGIFAPLATLAAVAALGAFDDYLNAKTGEGIRVRQKLIWQVVFAVAAAFLIQRTYAIDQIAVPFYGPLPVDPAVYVAFGAFAIIAAEQRREHHRRSRRARRRDAHVRVRRVPARGAAEQPAAAEPGVPLRADHRRAAGFLWFNVHPAQIFMGDSGSLSLGAALAVIALITGQILVLPLIGLIFVIETLSDIIQIGYFKLSGGKRVFKMAPLHHHFELSGWDEEKITLRFWIIGILAGLLGVTLFLASIQRLA